MINFLDQTLNTVYKKVFQFSRFLRNLRKCHWSENSRKFFFWSKTGSDMKLMNVKKSLSMPTHRTRFFCRVFEATKEIWNITKKSIFSLILKMLQVSYRKLARRSSDKDFWIDSKNVDLAEKHITFVLVGSFGLSCYLYKCKQSTLTNKNRNKFPEIYPKQWKSHDLSILREAKQMERIV